MIMMQAMTLREFTASISLCAITSLLGSGITAIIEIVQDQNYWEYPRWPASSIQDLVGYSIVVIPFFSPFYISYNYNYNYNN